MTHTNRPVERAKARPLAESLTRLRGLEPDVVLSSAFVNEAAVVEPGAGEWARAIDAAVERLTRPR